MVYRQMYQNQCREQLPAIIDPLIITLGLFCKSISRIDGLEANYAFLHLHNHSILMWFKELMPILHLLHLSGEWRSLLDCPVSY